MTLIGSRSCGNQNIPKFRFKNQYQYSFEGVNGVILNGPLINLGFSFKRIYSWVVFELRLLFWAFFSKKNKPDVIIVSSLSLLTFLTGKFLKKRYQCKLICEVRDIWPQTLIETKGLKESNIAIRVLSYIEKQGYKHSDMIVGSMKNLNAYIKKINPSYSERVIYIPTGFDTDYYIKNLEILDKVNTVFSEIPTDNFVVGYAGTIGRVNCVDEIIEVAYKMRYLPVSFVIFGKGVLKDHIEQKIKELNLTNVLLGGFYPKKYVPSILEKCDVLINPWLSNVTLYDYGVSPNKWIDYMFSGRPIIVALDGYKNIINEAACGVFVKAGDIDAMADAISYYRNMTKEELDKIGNNGKEFLLKNLTYKVLSKKYLAEIDKLFD
ncbi:MAG: glycosyltransferase family 4 protein [Acholeplasma sp.]|nr:glycosyltransferase family 4 protein [Acholeplasma sp.]